MGYSCIRSVMMSKYEAQCKAFMEMIKFSNSLPGPARFRQHTLGGPAGLSHIIRHGHPGHDERLLDDHLRRRHFVLLMVVVTLGIDGSVPHHKALVSPQLLLAVTFLPLSLFCLQTHVQQLLANIFFVPSVWFLPASTFCSSSLRFSRSRFRHLAGRLLQVPLQELGSNLGWYWYFSLQLRIIHSSVFCWENGRGSQNFLRCRKYFSVSSQLGLYLSSI